MAGSRRSRAAALAAALVLGASPLAAQLPLAITGRTSRVQGADTVPASDVAVTLHRVSRTAQGAIDSTTTGSDGRFQFRAAADTTAIYLVSASYAGIEYFAEPVRLPGAQGITIVVSDTSSTAPVRLGTRHLIIRPPDESGSRAILDLLSIRNDGPDTRIGRDSLAPSWQIVLPAGIIRPEVQEGDVSPSAVRFRGDTVDVLAPLAPGVKNMMLSYRLPVGEGRPAWIAPADSFDVLVEETGASVHGAGLEPTAPVELMGSTLRRWTAAPPTAGIAEVEFSGGPAALGRLLYWLVGLVAVALTAGAGWAFRRKPRAGAEAFAPLPADLVGEIARLDARYAGSRDRVDEAEWAAYESERARLKAAALARRRTHR